ncbi:MAG: hypothetical protein J6Y29_02660 [Clostridiales bacterium]|nr:hypothetical protein [Clostridiales bacterium]
MDNSLFWAITLTMGTICLSHALNAIKLIFIDKTVKYKSLSIMYGILALVMVGFYIYAFTTKRVTSLLPLSGILLGVSTINLSFNIKK